MFVSQELAQNLVAAIGSILLFNALENFIGDYVSRFAIAFVLVGVGLLLFAKKISVKVSKNPKFKDVVLTVGGILLFIGVKHYFGGVIMEKSLIFLFVGMLMIYYARNLSRFISTKLHEG